MPVSRGRSEREEGHGGSGLSRQPGRLVPEGGPGRLRGHPVFRLALAASGVALAAAAHVLAGDGIRMTHPEAALAAWGLAILLVLVATRVPAPAAPRTTEPPWTGREVAFFVMATLAALLLRVVATGRIPPALTGDEASAGLAGVDILEGRLDNVFGTSWYSFPAAYFLIPAGSIALLGRTFEALRIPSAIAGAATVAGLYLLARALWGRRTAVFASVLLTSLHFHVHFSRIGLNNVWDGLLAVMTLTFFWKAWESGRRVLFVAAGLSLGASQYFYPSGRLLPVLLASWVVLVLVFERRLSRERLADLAAMGLTALVVFLPLGLFFLHHPDEYTAPMNRVTILGPWLAEAARATGEPKWALVLRNFRDAASGFSTGPLRHWYRPGAPMLLAPAALLFHLGLLLALLRLRDPRPRLVLLWLAGVLAVGGLSESAPASQRYVVGAPAAALLAGWALASATAAAERRRAGLRHALLGLAAIVLAASAALDLNLYFRRYVPSGEALDDNTEVAMALADRLAREPTGTRVYFLGPPRMGFASIPTLPYLAPHVSPTDVDAPLSEPPAWPASSTPTLVVALPERADELRFVREALPGGREDETRGRAGQVLYRALVLPATPAH